MKKRVFYFNITYSCNNVCVFCYSHNTKTQMTPCNELSVHELENYLNKIKIAKEDRVIVNGGEPLLHSEVDEVFAMLKDKGCEVVVFTNGRLLNDINRKNLNDRFRFVVPIHGHEELHDKITRIDGSYKETIESMNDFLKESKGWLLDLKIILNHQMISDLESFEKAFETFKSVKFNNAVHITRMAETQISRQNGCIFVEDSAASRFTEVLLNYFVQIGVKVKIYDTCIKTIDGVLDKDVKKYVDSIEMRGMDYKFEEEIELNKVSKECHHQCRNHSICLSAVDEYKVLEFAGNEVYESLE